jgi:5-methylcytosine-specific restriction enzyme subunit McrC
VLDRTNQRWRELLSLAKLLLGERFQTTTSGSALGFSLLFEMNTLFEEYVARMLGRALAKDGLVVQRQGGRLYCLKELDGDGRPRFQTIPDILVRRGSETLLVVDTKWKRLSARIDDPKQGIGQADVYQMLAYSRSIAAHA